jgi:collagen type VII alpha
MANIIRVKHRTAGASGAPGAVGLAGEVAINFQAGNPELYGSDGSTWIRLNTSGTGATSPDVVTGTATASYISPSALAGAATSSTTGAGVANYYVRLNGSGLLDPALFGVNAVDTSAGAGDAGKLVKLDAAGKVSNTMLDLATAAEVQNGTGTTNVVEASILAAASVNGSVAPVAGDAGKYVRVGANGKIAAALLATSAMEFQGTLLHSAAQPGSADTGDVYVFTSAGTLGVSWGALSGTAVNSGTQAIYDGTNWNIISPSVDLSGYLPLAGTAGVTGAAMGSGAVIKMNPAAAGNVVFDANNGAIDGAILDAGGF